MCGVAEMGKKVVWWDAGSGNELAVQSRLSCWCCCVAKNTVVVHRVWSSLRHVGMRSVMFGLRQQLVAEARLQALK